MAIKTPEPKRQERYPLASGTVTKILLRKGDERTRVTLTGRDDGEVILKAKPYLIGDDNTAAVNFPDGEFETITGGTIDMSTDQRTRFLNGEFVALMVDDSAYSGVDTSFAIEIHQKA